MPKRKNSIQQISKQFKTHTTALGLFLQGFGSLSLGVVMLLRHAFFLTRMSQLIIIFFVFLCVTNFIRLLANLRKGMKVVSQRLFTLIASGVAVGVLWGNVYNLLHIIPFALTLWMLLMAVTYFISYLQYRNEKSVQSIRFLLAMLTNIAFAVFVFIRADDSIAASIRVLGIYAIALGVSLLLDALSEVIPAHFKNKIKHRVRIVPPVFVTLMLPQNLLDSINTVFQERDEGLPEFHAINPPVRPDEAQINVEIFIHVSKSLAGTTGHVDIAIEDTVYCYGAYDKKQSEKYAGIAGAGVMYEVHGKEKHRKACMDIKEETLFGFGLVLQEQELARIKDAIETYKVRAFVWQCPSQRARAAGQPTDVFADFPSKLANAVEVTYYKFKRGSYKYYWMLGTNCVTFVDDLLKISGMKTILTGIITPGTYYSFLNAEFLKGGTVVIKREVYTKARDAF